MSNSKKVLVVDDSLALRTHIASIISKAGYDVIEAENGIAAIDKMKENLDICVVVSDINMPKMTGIQMIEEIHKDQTLSGIPVIVVSTEEGSELVKKAREAGARGWLVKPFSPGQLISVIKKHALQ